jgi:chromate transporter
VLGRRAIVDLPTAVLAIVTFLILWKVRRVPEPIIILFSGIAGLFLR